MSTPSSTTGAVKTSTAEILAIEREGLEQADRIIAVSHRTRRMIEELYGITPEKIAVVYNAVTRAEAERIYHAERTGRRARRWSSISAGSRSRRDRTTSSRRPPWS